MELAGEYRFLPRIERERVTASLKVFISNTKQSGTFLPSAAVTGSMHRHLVVDDTVEKVLERVDGSDEATTVKQHVEPLTRTIPLLPSSEGALTTKHSFPYSKSISSAESDVSQSINDISWFNSYSADSLGLTDFELRDILLSHINQSVASSQAFVTQSMDSQECHLDDGELYLSSQVDDLSNDDAIVREDLALMTLSTEASTPEICFENTAAPRSHDHPPSVETEPRKQLKGALDYNLMSQALTTLDIQGSLPITQDDTEGHSIINRKFPPCKGDTHSQELQGTSVFGETSRPQDIARECQIGQYTDPDQDLRKSRMTTATETSVDSSTTESRDIESAFLSLYLEYCQSIPRITSLSSSNYASSSFQDPSNVQMDYVMSKQQLQLIVDEGNIWDKLVEPRSSVSATRSKLPEERDTGPALSLLAEKSSVMSQSYERRNNPPTAQTYEESKQIIKAMGIPCVEAAGAYEAEALAASLVINGYADYVASEDTAS